MKVLKVALDNGRYDLAAHALVLASLRVSMNVNPHVEKKLAPQQAKPLSQRPR